MSNRQCNLTQREQADLERARRFAHPSPTPPYYFHLYRALCCQHVAMSVYAVYVFSSVATTICSTIIHFYITLWLLSWIKKVVQLWEKVAGRAAKQTNSVWSAHVQCLKKDTRSTWNNNNSQPLKKEIQRSQHTWGNHMQCCLKTVASGRFFLCVAFELWQTISKGHQHFMDNIGSDTVGRITYSITGPKLPEPTSCFMCTVK